VALPVRLRGQLARVAEDVVEDAALEGGEAGVGGDAAHVQRTGARRPRSCARPADRRGC
jgi:hypothetical protein